MVLASDAAHSWMLLVKRPDIMMILDHRMSIMNTMDSFLKGPCKYTCRAEKCTGV